jgi:hypothetical protein
MTDPENVMGRTRVENAAWVIEQLRGLGFNPPPGSRLSEMLRVFRRGFIPSDDPDFLTALEAERDMQHLGFVFAQMAKHRDQPKLRELVKRLLSDSILPQHDRENSSGRDAQFELYVAAICQNAGLFPVEYAEPDVHCTVGDIRFAIAAKRAKSLGQLEKHVRKAAKQIALAGCRGVVALDVSLALDRDNRPIYSPLECQMAGAINLTKANQLIDEHHSRILDWVRGKRVRGIAFFNSWMQARPNGDWALEGMTAWMPTHEDGPAAKSEFDKFYRAFTRGMPNVLDLGKGG